MLGLAARPRAGSSCRPRPTRGAGARRRSRIRRRWPRGPPSRPAPWSRCRAPCESRPQRQRARRRRPAARRASARPRCRRGRTAGRRRPRRRPARCACPWTLPRSNSVRVPQSPRCAAAWKATSQPRRPRSSRRRRRDRPRTGSAPRSRDVAAERSERASARTPSPRRAGADQRPADEPRAAGHECGGHRVSRRRRSQPAMTSSSATAVLWSRCIERRRPRELAQRRTRPRTSPLAVLVGAADRRPSTAMPGQLAAVEHEVGAGADGVGDVLQACARRGRRRGWRWSAAPASGRRPASSAAGRGPAAQVVRRRSGSVSGPGTAA